MTLIKNIRSLLSDFDGDINQETREYVVNEDKKRGYHFIKSFSIFATILLTFFNIKNLLFVTCDPLETSLLIIFQIIMLIAIFFIKESNQKKIAVIQLITTFVLIGLISWHGKEVSAIGLLMTNLLILFSALSLNNLASILTYITGIVIYFSFTFYSAVIFDSTKGSINLAANYTLLSTAIFFLAILLRRRLYDSLISLYNESSSIRENVEIALENYSSQVTDITESIPGMIFQLKLDNDGQPKFMFLNSRVNDLYGVTFSEVIKDVNSIYRFMNKDDVKDIAKSVIKSAQEMSTLHAPHRVEINGIKKWYIAHAIPIENEKREIIWNGYVQDNTKQVLAESQLKQSEEKLRGLFELSSLGISLNSIDGKFLQVNQAMTKITGYTLDELNLLSYWDLTPEKYAMQEELQLESMRNNNRYGPYEKEYIHKNGTLVPVLLNGVVIETSSGERFIWSIVQDMTEHEKIQKVLAQSEKMTSIAGLAAGMAHEINNPLGIIIQTANNAKRRMFDEIPANLKSANELGLRFDLMKDYLQARNVSKYLAEIKIAGERAANIVSNMLDFSRKREMSKTNSNINEILEKAINIASKDFDIKKKYNFQNIEVVKTLALLPNISVVKSSLEQVFFNLFKNAVQAMNSKKYSNDTPKIEITTRIEKDHMVIVIEDNGIGMVEKVKNKVFEPFFTTKEPGDGTGLGMSVVYYIINSTHKGDISLESEENLFTRFIITLPIN